MGYTPKEFKKVLLGQFSTHTPYLISEVAENEWQLSHTKDECVTHITINVGEPRKIALLSLPVLHTQFDFKHANDIQQQDFMRLFFKYFHKGGG